MGSDADMPGESRIAVCPGSFDPLTNGHLDLIVRAARLFDRLIVAVVVNPQKQPWFSVEERVGMVRDVIAPLPDAGQVEVDTFDGLLVDYVRRRRAAAVIRGLRTIAEFADESQMALMNRHLSGECETVFLLPSPNVGYISSRLVKEVARLGGTLDGLVPPVVAAHLHGHRLTDRTVRV
jgi:pantetheine-phosphate adenylyltransferase